ncbi:hypothetical protein PvNV_041 [Penaeus vannamei nudivirus]|nr:hypothetical protein PvSNPV_041 [Penaeus vannamei nucleopolyhedrovirus]
METNKKVTFVDTVEVHEVELEPRAGTWVQDAMREAREQEHKNDTPDDDDDDDESGDEEDYCCKCYSYKICYCDSCQIDTDNDNDLSDTSYEDCGDGDNSNDDGFSIEFKN